MNTIHAPTETFPLTELPSVAAVQTRIDRWCKETRELARLFVERTGLTGALAADYLQAMEHHIADTAKTYHDMRSSTDPVVY